MAMFEHEITINNPFETESTAEYLESSDGGWLEALFRLKNHKVSTI